jgi:hypothetical protein
MSFGWPAMDYHRTVQHDEVPIHRINNLKEPK